MTSFVGVSIDTLLPSWGIPVETLDRHPYRMDDGHSFNGAYMTWRVLWQNQPPEGVKAEGSSGDLWTDIMAMTAVRED